LRLLHNEKLDLSWGLQRFVCRKEKEKEFFNYSVGLPEADSLKPKWKGTYTIKITSHNVNGMSCVVLQDAKSDLRVQGAEGLQIHDGSTHCGGLVGFSFLTFFLTHPMENFVVRNFEIIKNVIFLSRKL